MSKIVPTTLAGITIALSAGFLGYSVGKSNSGSLLSETQGADPEINQAAIPQPIQGEKTLATVTQYIEIIKTKDQEIARLSALNKELDDDSVDDSYDIEDSPSQREALISEMLTLTDAKVSFESSLDDSFSALIPDIPGLDQEQRDQYIDTLKQTVSWDKVEPTIYQIYAKTFTSKELVDLNAFYQTETGQSFAAKQAEVQKSSMIAVQGLMAESMPKIQTMLRGIFEESRRAEEAEISSSSH